MKKNILLALSLIILSSCHKENEVINSSEKPIDKLLSGNLRFTDGKALNIHHNLEAVTKTRKKQNPFAVVLTCSDSRVDPDIIFDQGIGDLFIVKNAGNLISDIDYGTIEYAVEHLNVKLIVVLGHTDCGAVKAFVSDDNKHYKEHKSHIDDIISQIDNENEIKKLDVKSKDYLINCIKANALHSVKQLTEDKLIKENKVKIVSLLYNVANGKVTHL
ncbi:carbonic anhydrase [Flavobacterium sp.]|uniref:carbonic anhydrase n=1 Tax=Flavobacterium sp. TaxID=239 RepID=UPI00262B4A66|nr:carbonic anhydrase [Flavobacterium sp.]MDG2432334.1 carbonic anhydrase [Flavobacterium sp.]